jgi:hypothetical protein
MVQRTDIAGSVGGGMGQVDPGDHGICRYAPNGAPIEKVIYLKSLTIPAPAARSAAGFFLTAVLSVLAIYVETPGPIKH